MTHTQPQHPYEIGPGGLGVQTPLVRGDREAILKQLKSAMYASMILTFAQGMPQMRAASQADGSVLDLEEVDRMWRGGCIIRAALLEDIRAAYLAPPDLANLLTDDRLGGAVRGRQNGLRTIVGLAGRLGLPLPCLVASLAYCDGYRSARLRRISSRPSVSIAGRTHTSVRMPKAFFILAGDKTMSRKANLS